MTSAAARAGLGLRDRGVDPRRRGGGPGGLRPGHGPVDRHVRRATVVPDRHRAGHRGRDARRGRRVHYRRDTRPWPPPRSRLAPRPPPRLATSAATPGDRVSRHGGGWHVPDMTTRTAAPGAVVIEPGTIAPGRARGAAPLRREGPAKLTGAAKYADDLVFPGAWFGATIRSTDAHARFAALDLDPGFDWSTVIVVTAADIPGDNIVSSIKSDQPILVPHGGEIQHHAEPLALLAAPDRATLRAARHAVRIRTDPLPAVFDPLASDHVFAAYELAARRPGRRLRGRRLRARGRVPGRPPGAALHREQRDDRGPVGRRRRDRPRLAAVPLLHPRRPSSAASASTTARRGSSRRRPAAGFGGKEEYPSMIALHAALLAGKAGRPVRMIYDRHEDIAATTKRHPAIVRHRTGVTRDGRLLAQDIEVVMDGGAYCTLTPVVLSRGAIHAGGPYRCPNVRIRARAARTNTPPNGAFRGFGAPQVEFAAETHLNRIAEAARASARSRSGAGTSTGSATRPRPARSCATASPARRCSSGRPRPASSSACAHATRRPGSVASARLRPASPPRRCGRAGSGWPAGSASRWPGTAPGSPARARSSSPRSPRSS